MDELPPPSLELRGVKKAFRRGKSAPFVAVQDLNVRVDRRPGQGEFVAIVGPSGCGKSTLLQLVAGFDTHLPPTEGQILCDGQPVTDPGAERGMLFQDYGCYPHLTVLGNIAFGLQLHAREMGLSRSEITQAAYAWMDKVHLAATDAHKYPHELSGGMRQRVALARCLALKPRFLLMDEPFSALDEPTRFGMQDLIVELWTEIDATILLVSHSVAEAVYLGDRVWLMSRTPGTIIAEVIEVPVPSPDVPAMVAQSGPEFAEAVHTVSSMFMRSLRTPRGQLRPVFADGRGHPLTVEEGV